MAKTPTTKPAEMIAAIITATEAPNAAATKEVAANLAALLKENTAAREALQQHFGEARWSKIKTQCEARLMLAAHIEATCGKAMRCVKEWHKEQSAECQLCIAANYFLTLIGSEPSEADEAAVDKLYKGTPAAAV